ncbi:MAG TPA: PilZ domain-containing protein [Anaeromyxobacteraceae bacterium]|nr:PilZ domain-containing protein [Anaeromyxobacteraceae bacterium]
MLSISVFLEPVELLSGIRQDGGCLVLPAQSAPRLREKVAVRVRLAGQNGGATVVGTVVSVHRHGGSFRLELAPDSGSFGAVRMLAATARGEVQRFPERSPRYLVKVPIVVSWRGPPVYMTMYSISEAGCGVRWSGPLPEIGQILQVRLGVGFRSGSVEGVLCWKAGLGASPTAGVRLLGGGGAEWARVLSEAARTSPRA